MKYLHHVVYLIVALLVIHFRFGLEALDPRSFKWLMIVGSDWASDYIMWLYYLNADWFFPLGLFDGLAYPLISSVGLTGGIPLISIPFKLIYPYLNQDVQLYGIYIFVCFYLQGYFSYKLLKCFFDDNIGVILSSLFFVLSPVLIDRIGHLNLTAHFIIIAFFYIYFSKLSFARKRNMSLLMTALSALIHPYLIPFCIVLAFVIFFQHYRSSKSIIKFIFENALNISLVLILYYLVGNFSLPMNESSSTGLGYYSANLNSLFNPMVKMGIFNKIKIASSGQYEGFGYLGFSVLILTLVAGFYWIRSAIRIDLKKHLLFILTIVGLFIFSLSNVITLGANELFEIPLPSFIEKIYGTFRSTGRFIWTAHYAVILFAVVGFWRSPLAKRWKIIALLLLLAIHVYDVHKLFDKRYINHESLSTELQNDVWKKVFQEADLAINYPLYEYGLINDSDFIFWASIAAKEKCPITTGWLPRFDKTKRSAFKEATEKNIKVQNIAPYKNDVFITSRAYLKDFDELIRSRSLFAYQIDRVYLMVPSDNKQLNDWLINRSASQTYHYETETVQDFFKRNYQHSIIMAARDYDHVCEMTINDEWGTNLEIPNLERSGSFLAVLKDQLLTHFDVSNNDQLILDFTEGGTIGTIKFPPSTYFKSSGSAMENRTYLLLNGKEYSLNQSGLNLLVLDDSLNVIESSYFENNVNCSHLRITNIH